MNELNARTYWVKIYIGSVRGYNGTKILENEVVNAIGLFQKNHKKNPLPNAADIVSVTLSQTTYIVEDYVEDGWVIGAIQYPRFIKQEQAIFKYMYTMAEFLLERFEQNRLTLMTPITTRVLEKENAESHPKLPK